MLKPIMEKFEDLSFEEAISKLEKLLEQIEKDEDASEEIYADALALKEHCSFLLEKEKAEIVKIANENGIPLTDIGLTADGNLPSTEEENK